MIRQALREGARKIREDILEREVERVSAALPSLLPHKTEIYPDPLPCFVDIAARNDHIGTYSNPKEFFANEVIGDHTINHDEEIVVLSTVPNGSSDHLPAVSDDGGSSSSDKMLVRRQEIVQTALSTPCMFQLGLPLTTVTHCQCEVCIIFSRPGP